MSDSSPTIERAVLACPLIDPTTLHLVASMQREDFTSRRNRAIFSAYKDMAEEGVVECDMLILKDWLQRHDKEEEAGGISYIAALDEDLPDVGGLPRYMRELERQRRRRDVRACAELVAGEPIDAHVEALREALQGLDGASDSNVADGAALAELLVSDHEEATLQTGMHHLDGMIGGGLSDGQLVIVAAKTGYGKSALASQWARHAAIEQNNRVAYFSLEMTKRDMACRLAAQESGVSWVNIRDKTVPGMHRSEVDAAQHAIAKSGFIVDDRPNLSLSALATTCRELQRRGLDLVVVDYIQLMRSPKKDNRSLEVGALTRGLKILAKDLSVPIVAISQFSRQAGQHNVPKLEDLKESSSIEQDADLVIFVHKSDTGTQDVDLLIKKNRHGGCGSIKMRWDGPSMSFSDVWVDGSGGGPMF